MHRRDTLKLVAASMLATPLIDSVGYGFAAVSTGQPNNIGFSNTGFRVVRTYNLSP